ncbi:MAG: hypothetical protein LBC70_09685 [Chitinispirillales bacterium]|jgi:hypothetical protein|nr:hypothetical protein [Chitinispirillales bacterium]
MTKYLDSQDGVSVLTTIGGSRGVGGRRLMPAVAIFFALIWVAGCIDVVDPGDTGLILPDGEAWVDSWPIGERDGYIFLKDRRFLHIDDEDGYWVSLGGGTWFVSGNLLTLTYYFNGVPDQPMTQPYIVSGNTLIIDNVIYTRTRNVVPYIAFKSRALNSQNKKNIPVYR